VDEFEETLDEDGIEGIESVEGVDVDEVDEVQEDPEELKEEEITVENFYNITQT
jgi:hypothetical protein